MLNSLKKFFQKEKPTLASLQTFPYKDYYFYRVATWDWISESQIHIYDPHEPRMITLDEWPQMVFLDARGMLTVTEYVDYVASLYDSPVQDLDQTIIHQLNSLAAEKLITYANAKKKLESKFEFPLSSQRSHDS